MNMIKTCKRYKFQAYEPSVTVGRGFVSGAFPKLKLGTKGLDDKPNFSGTLVLAFPLTTVLEFNAFVAGEAVVVDNELAPSATGFTAERPNEIPKIKTLKEK